MGLNSFWRRFWSALSGSKHLIAIDLGSANTTIYLANHGIVLNEPTVLAQDVKNEKVVAIGETAKQMLGRTPDHIQIIRPVNQGVVSDPTLLEIYLKHLIDQAVDKIGYGQSAGFVAVVTVPSGATQVDSRALQQLLFKIGASKVFLLPQIYAAAIGAKIPFRDIRGQMIVQLGESSTEIGVFSLSNTVYLETLPIGGAKFTQNITQAIRDEFNLLIGATTAEDAKIRVLANTTSSSSLSLSREKQNVMIRGRDLNTGLPRTIQIDQSLIQEAIAKDLVEIASTIKKCVEGLPPEIAVDIHDNGINLSGGGALIADLDDVVTRFLETNVVVVSDPITAVIRGCGAVVENIPLYQDILQNYTL